MIISEKQLFSSIKDILISSRVPEKEAKIVTEELTMSNLMGVDSHGVLRVPQYLWQMEEGFIVPGANVKVVKETDTTAIVDADHGFGHVAARFMADIVSEKAEKNGIACATCINCTHIGRAGAYTERIARRGLLAFGTAGLYSGGPLAPYGAAEGRLGTNPISWAVPQYGRDPIIMDGATTVIAEGKLRTYIQKGQPVPEGWIRDGMGRDTTDPNDFYREPKGTILPLGGLNGGAKGSALAIMADLFGIALVNEDYWTCLKKGEKVTSENGFFLMAVDPERFYGRETYAKQVRNHADYIKSAKPAQGFREVLLPGELEFRTAQKRRKEGIEIPDETWMGIVAIGQKLGCEWSNSYPKIETETEFVHF